ncbi:MAG: hypothetical protein IH600_05600 [Bacteroidetes bacterium]|nr:hypothetical protein [Bacteroidota bacterium]
MKKSLTTLALMLAFVALPLTTSFAQDARPLTDRQMELIQTNVLANLESPSMEVRATTMQLLIDLKKTYPAYDINFAVLPMMETLKSDEKPEFRILAALTLYHLDSELGRFAVERRAQYDSNDRVARHCSMLARNWGKAAVSTDLIAETQRKF